MLLEALISTTYSRHHSAIALAEYIFNAAGVRSVIVCQLFDSPNFLLQPADYENRSYRIFFVTSKGLSKSRNFALENCHAKYGWLLDDDVEVDKVCLRELLSTIGSYDGVSGLTFKFSDKNGLSRKKYKEKCFKHNFFSIMKVSSIEIVINVEFLKCNNINLDDRFGLGSEYPSGEENVLLSDVLKSGGDLHFVPINICYHPLETSSSSTFSVQQWRAKGALLARVYGLLGSILIVPFVIKRLIGKQTTVGGFFKGVKGMCNGFKDTK